MKSIAPILQQELAIEIIGDMIAFYMSQIDELENAPIIDSKKISELDEQIEILGEEGNLCYYGKKEVFKKAFDIYAPFLLEKSKEVS